MHVYSYIYVTLHIYIIHNSYHTFIQLFKYSLYELGEAFVMLIAIIII